MILGVAIGCLGIAVALVNDPVYKVLLAIRKEKFATEIRKLSEKIISLYQHSGPGNPSCNA